MSLNPNHGQVQPTIGGSSIIRTYRDNYSSSHTGSEISSSETDSERGSEYHFDGDSGSEQSDGELILQHQAAKSKLNQDPTEMNPNTIPSTFVSGYVGAKPVYSRIRVRTADEVKQIEERLARKEAER